MERIGEEVWHQTNNNIVDMIQYELNFGEAIPLPGNRHNNIGVADGTSQILSPICVKFSPLSPTSPTHSHEGCEHHSLLVPQANSPELTHHASDSFAEDSACSSEDQQPISPMIRGCNITMFTFFFRMRRASGDEPETHKEIF